MVVSQRDRRKRASGRRASSVEALEERTVLSGVFTEFPVASGPPPAFTMGVEGMTSGPDGRVWFVDRGAGQIGAIDAAGHVVKYDLPGHPAATAIVTGPDGALWFTDFNGAIGRFDPQTHAYSSYSAGPDPEGIVAGPDGNLWFTHSTSPEIGRITPDGVVTEFTVAPYPTLHSTYQIAAGADGNLWFTGEGFSDRYFLGKITTSGEATLVRIPSDGSLEPPVFDITSGPDGNIWFQTSSTLGRITPDGQVTEFPTGDAGRPSGCMTAGPDGAIWFTTLSNRVGRMTTDGVVTYLDAPAGAGFPQQITVGPDGNFWYSREFAGSVGRIDLTPEDEPPVDSTITTVSLDDPVAATPPPATPAPTPALPPLVATRVPSQHTTAAANAASKLAAAKKVVQQQLLSQFLATRQGHRQLARLNQAHRGHTAQMQFARVFLNWLKTRR